MWLIESPFNGHGIFSEDHLFKVDLKCQISWPQFLGFWGAEGGWMAWWGRNGEINNEMEVITIQKKWNSLIIMRRTPFMAFKYCLLSQWPIKYRSWRLKSHNKERTQNEMEIHFEMEIKAPLVPPPPPCVLSQVIWIQNQTSTSSSSSSSSSFYFTLFLPCVSDVDEEEEESEYE